MGEVVKAHQSSDTDLIACVDCDLLLRLPPVRGRADVYCTRCGGLIYASYPQTINHTLAMTVTALILFILANSFPFLTMRYHGIQTEATLITGIINLINQGYTLVAILVGLTSWLVPLAELSILFYILLPMRLGWVLPGTRFMLSGLTKLRPWSMSEVYLLGVVIAAVKLSERSDIVPGVAMWAFVALIFVLAATLSSVDTRRLWRRLDNA